MRNYKRNQTVIFLAAIMVCGSALNLALAQPVASDQMAQVSEGQTSAAPVAKEEAFPTTTNSEASTSFKDIKGDVPLPPVDQDTGETRSLHAARINRNIAFIGGSILAVFIACRLLLLMQLTKRRRKIAREQNNLEG